MKLFRLWTYECQNFFLPTNTRFNCRNMLFGYGFLNKKVSNLSYLSLFKKQKFRDLSMWIWHHPFLTINIRFHCSFMLFGFNFFNKNCQRSWKLLRKKVEFSTFGKCQVNSFGFDWVLWTWRDVLVIQWPLLTQESVWQTKDVIEVIFEIKGFFWVIQNLLWGFVHSCGTLEGWTQSSFDSYQSFWAWFASQEAFFPLFS